MSPFHPAYQALTTSGEYESRIAQSHELLRQCVSCGWRCKVNRLEGELGVCKTGALAQVSSYGPHLGEENPLRGWRGSGTVFFSRCNLRCQFCQNADISQFDNGADLDIQRLAEVFLELQHMGCHNINLVSPTHVVPQIIAAVLIAAQAGLHLPLVYNTGGYDSLEALALLDGIVDIYMPDMKYANPQTALRYSRIPHYPQTNQAAVREMHRQVGDLVLDENNLAQRGLMVRHLVLPNGLAGTGEIMKFIAEEISPETYINIMDQYHPAYRAREYPRVNRRITAEEFQQAVQAAQSVGLHRLDHLQSE
jgi:putative pyruvate formate lyase activating enzyme